MNRFRNWRDKLHDRLGLACRRWRLVLIGMAALAALMLLDVARYAVWPGVSNLARENPRDTAMMRFRTDRDEKHGKRAVPALQWVPLSRISPYVVKAVIIAEDDKFWSHEGFDFEAIQKAIEKDIEKRQFRFGGSTISQQLAKNLYLSPSKNPVRKLKEAVLTWRLERALTKSRIIELYLNVAEWGDGIFGIEAAARHYYGVPASALGPEQAARLAAVLPNPRSYSPVNPSRYVANRARIIYSIMARRGVVMPEYGEIVQPPLRPEDGQGKAPIQGEPFENNSGAASPPVLDPVTTTLTQAPGR